MRGIARTDSLIRLVMWGALLAAAWILLSPGKASASEHPVEDVERSVTSLTGTVLGHAAPKDAPPGVEDSRKAPVALSHKEIGADVSHSVGSLVEPVLKLAQPAAQTLEPVLEPVARPLEPVVEPVVATTTHTVRTTIHDVTGAVSSTTEAVPVLQAPVQELTGVVDGVVDGLPVVGAEPVVELPVPGLPGATPAQGADPTPGAPVSDPSLGEATAPTSPSGHEPVVGQRNHPQLVEDVTAGRERTGPSVPRAASPAAAVGAEVSADDSVPNNPQPWPAGPPSPAGPVPGPSSAGAAGQSTGGDVPADLLHTIQGGDAATTTTDRHTCRVPGALNARPGLRPD